MIVKRCVFVLFAILLALALGAPGALQADESPNGWDPDASNPDPIWTEPGYEGLPDLQRNSAEFLVLNGARFQNQSFEGDEVGRHVVQLSFPSDATSVRIAIFDADADGIWDQRSGDAILLFAPRVDYEVFADPDGTIAGDLVGIGKDDPLPPAIAAQQILMKTSDEFTDSGNKWCALFDEPVANADVQKGLTTKGDYRFTLRVALIPNSDPVPDFPGAPGTGLQGTERCGYKMAFNGTYLLPAGGILGFGGGVIDQRFLVQSEDETVADSRDPMPGEAIPGTNLTNVYDGNFSFLFSSAAAKMEDVEFYEGDADWNAPIDVLDPDGDTQPSGVPPDDGGLHDITIRPGFEPPGYIPPVIPLRDNSIFTVSPSIRWFIFPTDREPLQAKPPQDPTFTGPLFASNVHPNRETVPAGWPNHPSVNVLYQSVEVLPQFVEADIFQKYILTKSVMLSDEGLWTLRWHGVDASNFVFFAFNKDVGTTVTQNLRGRCFCDNNGNGTYEEDVDSEPPAPCELSIQKVSAPGVPDGPAIPVTTEADGTWGPIDVDPGTYEISLLGDLNATVPLPITVIVPEGGCPEVDIPLECLYGPICGWVYCEDGENCCYDEGFDRFLPEPYLPATVVVTPIDPVGPPFEVMTDEFGHYCTDKLPAGIYKVTVKPGTIPFPVANECPTFHDVTVEVGSEQIDDICFPYECEPPEVCGRIWCDDIMNNEFDPGELPLTVDVPFPGDVWSVEVTKTGDPQFLEEIFPDENGEWCFKFPMDGEYHFTVLYNGTEDYPPQTIIQNPATQTREVKLSDEEDPEDVLHTFKCPGRICGKVYCSPICRPEGAVGPYNPDNGDMLLQGAVVTLTDANGGKRTKNTDENGEYCFELVLLGPYTLTVEIPEPLRIAKNITGGPTPSERVVVLRQQFKEVLDQDFGYCCPPPPAEICVRIFCDDDCDGILDRGEPSYPGIKVLLLDINGNVIRTHTSLPGPIPDEICWINLPPGTYKVVVDPASVPPGASVTVGDGMIVVVGPGDVVGVDVGICKPAEICGYVFIDPKGECDGVWQPTDIPVEDAEVMITHVPSGRTATILTDENGYYCFSTLRPGTYVVKIIIAGNVILEETVSLATDESVEVSVKSQESKRVDFGFCQQQICGKVWKEPEEYCDGEFDVQMGDELIEGLEIQLTGVSGDGAGIFRTTLTDENGEYCFPNLPTGIYEVRVSDNPNNEPLLVNLTAQDPTVRLPQVDLGDCLEDVDFYYCECTQKICVKVFVEKGKDCDGEFDEGVDECLSWVQVHVKEKGADQYLTFDFTNEDGIVCFDLPPGEYKVYVGANQDRTYGLRPCNEKNPCPATYVVLEPCEDEKVYFCFCRECPKQPCCEGKLHEVVFDTKIWVGECDECFAVSAHLRADCDDEDKGFYDEVWMDYCDDFPGPKTGAEGVITIEDVKILNGVAVVRVRIKAVGWDLHGYFPDRKLPISVYVNGKSSKACVKLRCETMRPGAVFPWTPECGRPPECVTPEGYVWDRYWNWFYCDKCPAPFIVIDSLSYESWRYCNPCEPDPRWKDICLSYDGGDGDLHEYIAKLKVGGELLDTIKLEFNGVQWTGDMGGSNGLLTLLKIWEEEGGCWKAKVRIHYDCGCVESWLPEDLKVWSKLDDCSRDKRIYLLCNEDR